MNTSTHYNLNLVEGTDLVNPLVQDVPNYEAIDAQMYLNECASIATAVELLTGTVHALTRANENAPVFRFTATSDFTAGETFVVDGTQVTALLPSGEALGTGAYVIGSEVICALRDTRLTFYTTGGIQSVAADSEKLGGELPAHYATASAVETAQATATAAGVLAQSNTSQIAELNDSLANKDTVTVLGTTNTTGYDISVDLTQFSKLVLELHNPTNNVYGTTTIYIDKCMQNYYVNHNGTTNVYAHIEIFSNSLVNISVSNNTWSCRLLGIK